MLHAGMHSKAACRVATRMQTYGERHEKGKRKKKMHGVLYQREISFTCWAIIAGKEQKSVNILELHVNN